MEDLDGDERCSAFGFRVPSPVHRAEPPVTGDVQQGETILEHVPDEPPTREVVIGVTGRRVERMRAGSAQAESTSRPSASISKASHGPIAAIWRSKRRAAATANRSIPDGYTSLMRRSR